MCKIKRLIRAQCTWGAKLWEAYIAGMIVWKSSTKIRHQTWVLVSLKHEPWENSPIQLGLVWYRWFSRATLCVRSWVAPYCCIVVSTVTLNLQLFTCGTRGTLAGALSALHTNFLCEWNTYLTDTAPSCINYTCRHETYHMYMYLFCNCRLSNINSTPRLLNVPRTWGPHINAASWCRVEWVARCPFKLILDWIEDGMHTWRKWQWEDW